MFCCDLGTLRKMVGLLKRNMMEVYENSSSGSIKCPKKDLDAGQAKCVVADGRGVEGGGVGVVWA